MNKLSLTWNTSLAFLTTCAQEETTRGMLDKRLDCPSTGTSIRRAHHVTCVAAVGMLDRYAAISSPSSPTDLLAARSTSTATLKSLAASEAIQKEQTKEQLPKEPQITLHHVGNGTA